MITRLICTAKTKWYLVFVIILLTVISCKKDPDIINNSDLSIVINDTIISLAVGGQQKLIYNTNPVNAKWVSSDTTIVKVNNQGIITGISAGYAIITVSGNSNFSGRCQVKVTDTPVSELIMPDVNYPIHTGSTFIIQGVGFKEGDKIWLRKHVTNSSVNKVKGANNEINTSEGSDYLATIHEIAANYIAISANVPDGWYQLILEEVNKAYNLGNLQLSTVEFPAYTYDKTKIFWDDTHWRRFQLRGKVKSMTTMDDNFTDWVSKHIYNFNKNGFLESSAQIPNDGSMHGYTTYRYDNYNRLKYKSLHSDSDLSSIGNEKEYIYGNHSMYIQSNIFSVYDYALSPEYYTCFYYGIGYADFTMSNDLEMWFKGLTGIKYTKSGQSFTLEITSNTVSYTDKRTEYSDKESYSYQGNFPYQSNITRTNIKTGEVNEWLSDSYEFSSTGMRQKLIEKHNTYLYTSEWVSDCPFNLYKTYQADWFDGNYKFTYDKNWNMSTLENDYELVTFYYTSYDEFGNWIECTVIIDYGDNNKGIAKLSRRFTYW